MVKSKSKVTVIKMEIQVPIYRGFYLQKVDFKKTECKVPKCSQPSFGRQYSLLLPPKYNSACRFVWVSKVIPRFKKTTYMGYMNYQITGTAGQ